MPLSKTAQLDERLFRCSAHSWRVQITRTTALPPEDPRFESPQDVWNYFQRIKRTFTVFDENVSDSQEFDNWSDAWKLFCKTVMGYSKFFPMLNPKPGEFAQYEIRYDQPDPTAEEPIH
jgi:hypothetical protein